MNAHPDRVFEVHISSETHKAISEPDDIVVNGFVTSLLDLGQLDDGDIPLHSNKVLLENTFHASPIANFSHW